MSTSTGTRSATITNSNIIQVYYEGLEDEPIRRVEVGSVAFRPPPSRYLTASIPTNNFGVNALFELGQLQMQVLAATQKGSAIGERVFTIGQAIGDAAGSQPARPRLRVRPLLLDGRSAHAAALSRHRRPEPRHADRVTQRPAGADPRVPVPGAAADGRRGPEPRRHSSLRLPGAGGKDLRTGAVAAAGARRRLLHRSLGPLDRACRRRWTSGPTTSP